MTEFQVPAIFKKGGMSPAFQNELGGQDDNLSEGIGQSYPVIGYKGKVWTLRYRGQKYTFNDDKGFALPYIDVVILQQSKVKSKSFFPKYAGQQSDGERPLCSSMDGIVPDVGVRQKQSETCALCPRNVWRTDAQGKKGRECQDFKRLAVLISPTLTEPLLGLQLLEPVFLRIPPASLNPLATMGDGMDRQGYHYASYLTRITFDQTKSWPEMRFEPTAIVPDEMVSLIVQLRNDPVASRITVGDPRPTTTTGGASLSALSGSNQPGILQPTVAATSLLRSIATAPPATPTMAPSSPASPVQVGNGQSSLIPSTTPGMPSSGFGGAHSVGETQMSSLRSLSSMSDAGEPEESDADIDAQIAAIIAAK